MKRFLALMVSLVLCVTDVCAMSESEGILYEETKAGTEESAFGELEISTIGCFDGGVYRKGNLREGGR